MTILDYLSKSHIIVYSHIILFPLYISNFNINCKKAYNLKISIFLIIISISISVKASIKNCILMYFNEMSVKIQQ